MAGYWVGDLEAHYPKLPIEEDFFVNYGFVRRDVHHLMHPRTARIDWSPARTKQAQDVLAFVREAGVVRPAQVDAHFDHGRVVNWFGGNHSRSRGQFEPVTQGCIHAGLPARATCAKGGQRLKSNRKVLESLSLPLGRPR